MKPMYEALTGLIEIMKINARASDLLYRFGGDEFVMVLLDCTDEQAAELIHRIRVGFAASPIRSGSTNILLTGSFGVSQARTDSTKRVSCMRLMRPCMRGNPKAVIE
jgi:diguanylate cyclase (GGDEF)-like protein